MQINVNVFSMVPNSPPQNPEFFWYREGTELEKKEGHHIVIDDILDEDELNLRLKRGTYGRY